MRTDDNIDHWISKTFAVIGSILAAGIVAVAVVGSSSVRPEETATNNTKASVAAEEQVQRSGVLLEYQSAW
jgi:hypothetical protein